MINAHLQPLPFEKTKSDSMYRLLEIYMQALGLLTPFRESLNWQEQINIREIGSLDELKQLQKCAAQSDGLLLIIAKWSKNTIYRHLILHPNTEGYYLPLRFEEPFLLEHSGKKVWFGSSVRLAEELGWLRLLMEKKYNSKGETYTYWQNLIKCCEESMRTMTPIHLVKDEAKTSK